MISKLYQRHAITIPKLIYSCWSFCLNSLIIAHYPFVIKTFMTRVHPPKISIRISFYFILFCSQTSRFYWIFYSHGSVPLLALPVKQPRRIRLNRSSESTSNRWYNHNKTKLWDILYLVTTVILGVLETPPLAAMLELENDHISHYFHCRCRAHISHSANTSEHSALLILKGQSPWEPVEAGMKNLVHTPMM